MHPCSGNCPVSMPNPTPTGPKPTGPLWDTLNRWQKCVVQCPIPPHRTNPIAVSFFHGRFPNGLLLLFVVQAKKKKIDPSIFHSSTADWGIGFCVCVCLCACALYKDGLIPQPAAPVQPRSPFCVGVSFLLLLLLLLLFAVSSIYYFHCQTMKLSTVALPLCLVTGWCFFCLLLLLCSVCFGSVSFFHHSSSIFISHFLAQLLALFCVTCFFFALHGDNFTNERWVAVVRGSSSGWSLKSFMGFCCCCARHHTPLSRTGWLGWVERNGRFCVSRSL